MDRDAETLPEPSVPRADGASPGAAGELEAGGGSDPTGRLRVRLRVEGVVQGVGFRPFVYSLASALGLGGSVYNDAAGVVIEVEGPASAIERFRLSVEHEPPPAAVVRQTTSVTVPTVGDRSFTIVASDPAGRRRALVAADLATCRDCLRELFDPADRRYRYPFLNCTNCGPRFTIVREVPYDRAHTVMAGFAMCEACRREYDDPGDRRFHAQPVCCPACGPSLALVDGTGAVTSGDGSSTGDPLDRAVALLRQGAVVAVKGLGGYHLAVLAADEVAAARLRQRKHREDKPFAVMVADGAAAASLCHVDGAEASALQDPSRPIVLLRRRHPATGPARVAAAVAPGARHLGVMLPYTPLHHLLTRALGEPFVLTSGNVSDEPIAFRDDDAFDRLGGIADAFLTHDRPVHVRVDDSVLRVVRGRSMLLRRSRGSVPRPITLRHPVPEPVVACGADLKSTFCVARGTDAFVSHHIGDLQNYETMRSFTEGVRHFEGLFDVCPAAVVHDLHPGYRSTGYALERAEREGLAVVGVQHHHAHLASCLADNGESGPAIGVVFDGSGYGLDETVWGGEILVGDARAAARVGHLEPVPLPGGAAAIREPWRMAAVYLAGSGSELDLRRIPGLAGYAGRYDQVVAMAERRVNSPLTSSVGRLFDAVSVLVTGRGHVNYEGQAAIELEQLVDPSETGGYELPLVVGPGAGPFTLQGAPLVAAAAADVVAGTAPPVVAARAHHGIAAAAVAACEEAHRRTSIRTVALSGGVFQNVVLLERVRSGLERRGFRVLVHSQVPPNDGGISLGQAAVAAARLTGPAAARLTGPAAARLTDAAERRT